MKGEGVNLTNVINTCQGERQNWEKRGVQDQKMKGWIRTSKNALDILKYSSCRKPMLNWGGRGGGREGTGKDIIDKWGRSKACREERTDHLAEWTGIRSWH